MKEDKRQVVVKACTLQLIWLGFTQRIGRYDWFYIFILWIPQFVSHLNIRRPFKSQDLTHYGNSQIAVRHNLITLQLSVSVNIIKQKSW